MHIRTRTTFGGTDPDRTAIIQADIPPDSSDITWSWSPNSTINDDRLYFSGESILKDEQGLPPLPYRFKNCTHISRKYDFTFNRRFNIEKTFTDDGTGGTFVTSSGFPSLFSDAATVTAHALHKNIVQHVSYAQFTLSGIEEWFGDRRIPGGITIDRDAIRSDFSIWYLLWDIKDLFFGFSHWIPKLRKLRSGMSAHQKGEACKALADGHLQFQFGLVASWHDIVDCIAAFKKLSDAAEELKRASKILHKYRQKPLPLVSKRSFEHISQTTLFGGLVLPVRQLVEVTTPRLWHGTLYYTYKCEALQGLLKRIKYFADLFGVFDAAALWDIIPFSFLIDWFVDVGSWLHDHSPKLYPVDTNVKDYCESLKQTVEVTYTTGNVWLARRGAIPPGEPRGDFVPFVPGSHGEGELRFAKARHVYFTRRRFIPNVRMGAAGLKVDNWRFNFRRMAIAQSLVAQRVPRAKSWSDDFDILTDIDFGDRVNIRPLGRPKAKGIPKR